MQKQRGIFYFVVLLTFVGAASAYATSVWDQMRQRGSGGMRFVGTVQMISLDDQQNEMVFRVRALAEGPQAGREQVFTLCNRGRAPSRGTLVQDHMAHNVRMAFESGRTIEVAYGSLFDRCVSHIQVQDKKSSQKRAQLTEFGTLATLK